MKVGGEAYRIFHPASADALIREEDFADDERLPYWADLWPSAVALARYLSGRNLAGRRAIELGCGVGLPSAVALKQGAEVLATDYYEPALDFAAYNARANTNRVLYTRFLDWFSPKIEEVGRFDIVLAADVLYEHRNVRPLAGLVPRLLARGGEMLLADPRRKDTPEFLAGMKASGFRHSAREMPVEQGGKAITVMLHQLARR